MIGDALYEILSTNPAVAALAGERITASIIPQDQDVPCIYYGTDSVKPIPVRTPLGNFSGSVEVGFQTATYADLDAVTTAIRSALDNYSGVAANTTLKLSRGDSTPDDYDDTLKLHTRALTYQASGAQTQ